MDKDLVRGPAPKPGALPQDVMLADFIQKNRVAIMERAHARVVSRASLPAAEVVFTLRARRRQRTNLVGYPCPDPRAPAARLAQTAEVWTPTPLPAGLDTDTVVRHGTGYTVYERESSGAFGYRDQLQDVMALVQGGGLRVDPCIPPEWPGFEATIRLGDQECHVIVDNTGGSGREAGLVTLDGIAIDEPLVMPGAGTARRELRIVRGAAARAAE